MEPNRAFAVYFRRLIRSGFSCCGQAKLARPARHKRINTPPNRRLTALYSDSAQVSPKSVQVPAPQQYHSKRAKAPNCARSARTENPGTKASTELNTYPCRSRQMGKSPWWITTVGRRREGKKGELFENLSAGKTQGFTGATMNKSRACCQCKRYIHNLYYCYKTFKVSMICQMASWRLSRFAITW